jgi:hypothetical protein
MEAIGSDEFYMGVRSRAARWKASLLRGFLDVLDREGWRSEVESMVTAEVRELMADPPPPTAWVAAPSANMPIITAVARAHGLSSVVELTRGSVDRGFVGFIRPAVARILRVAGGGPETLFARMKVVIGSTMRGYEFVFEQLGASRGRLVVKSAALRENEATAHSWAGGLQNIYALAGTTGAATVERVDRSPLGSTIHLSLEWAGKS